MSIMLTIFDVYIKEERVYGSLCFELIPQQMNQSKKKYIDLVSIQISTSRSRWMLSGIWRLTYVTWTSK